MADDSILDFLHMEIVSYVYRSAKKDEKDNCVTKLERIGYSTGYRLIERLTKEWPRFKDELDIVKFICKDFWMTIYKKHIDTLRTNNQVTTVVSSKPGTPCVGVFVLLDNSCRFLSPMSADKQYLEYAPRYVAFPCGLIRGALANLGLRAVVTAEVSSMPSC